MPSPNRGPTSNTPVFPRQGEAAARAVKVRHKGGATLTPAGEQLLRHAPNFLQLWQRMQRQVAVPTGHSAFLTIGGEVNLWQPIVLDWTRSVRRTRPDSAFNAKALASGSTVSASLIMSRQLDEFKESSG